MEAQPSWDLSRQEKTGPGDYSSKEGREQSTDWGYIFKVNLTRSADGLEIEWKEDTNQG